MAGPISFSRESALAEPDPRRRAVETLLEVLPARGEGVSLRLALARTTGALADGDRGLFMDLCFGVCRNYRLHEYWLEAQLERPLRNRARPVRLAILCGLHELWFSERPPHAVVNAWPDICRKLGHRWATGLVNAVLRKAAATDAATVRAGLAPPVAWSLPDWLWEQWLRDWPEQAEDMARASATAPPMTLRFDRRRLDRTGALALLEEAGIQASAGRLSPWSLYLEKSLPVQQVPGFTDGLFSVQDEAAQLPVEQLEVPEGGRVLDACAAPGGKTGQMAEHFPEAELVALERDAERLERVRENMERLGAPATLLCGDATEPASWWDGRPFDAILLDAPCSATGILRRQPDSKWHRRASDIGELAGLQARMAGALWPLVRPGGMLVYATCATLRQENEQVVRDFLARHPQAREDTDTTGLPNATDTGVQLLPQTGAHDGFYFARLRKLRG